MSTSRPISLILIVCSSLAFLYLVGFAYFISRTDPQTVIPCQTVFDPVRFNGDVAAEKFLRKAIPVGAEFNCVRMVMSHPRMVPSKSMNLKSYHSLSYREKLGPWYEYPFRLGLNTRIVNFKFNSKGDVEVVTVI